MTVTTSDGKESVAAKGGVDDNSDESIVSPKLIENAVLNGIGKMSKICHVTLGLAHYDGEDAHRFSCTWKPPRTVRNLAAGRNSLVKMFYLVANGDLSVEDFLIGLPVLQKFEVDTKDFFEKYVTYWTMTTFSSFGRTWILPEVVNSADS